MISNDLSWLDFILGFLMIFVFLALFFSFLFILRQFFARAAVAPSIFVYKNQNASRKFDSRYNVDKKPPINYWHC